MKVVKTTLIILFITTLGFGFQCERNNEETFDLQKAGNAHNTNQTSFDGENQAEPAILASYIMNSSNTNKVIFLSIFLIAMAALGGILIHQKILNEKSDL